jgi:hypothetical protein
MSTEHARIMCVIRMLHLVAKLPAPSRCRLDAADDAFDQRSGSIGCVQSRPETTARRYFCGSGAPGPCQNATSLTKTSEDAHCPLGQYPYCMADDDPASRAKAHLRRAHHPTLRSRMVGTLRFAHPTIHYPIESKACLQSSDGV